MALNFVKKVNIQGGLLMIDFLGNQIRIGNTIVYPGRQGSRLWMNRAIVTVIRKNGIQVQRPDGDLRTLRRIENVVVVNGSI